MSVPEQLRASLLLSLVSVADRYVYCLLKPIEVWDKIFNFLSDILGFLRAFALVACHNHPLDPYLIMLDERAHAAEDRLEGREPIGGFFRNIKENLCAVRDSMPVCWEPPSR